MAVKRELGILGVFGVGASAMISSGLFVLPAIVFEKDGPGVFLCYALPLPTTSEGARRFARILEKLLG